MDCAGLGALSRKIAPHLDEVVRNHAQPHPTAHAVQTGIEATSQPVSSFEHADSTLRTGSPLLPATKPTLVLKKFPVATCGVLVGHRHPPHPQRLSRFLVLARTSVPIRQAQVNPGLIGIYFRFRRLMSDFSLGSFGLRAEPLRLSEDFQVQDLCYEGCYIPSDLVASVARLDTAFYLQNILLRDSDVFGMANSLEIRVPFLDRDLVEWAFRLPGSVLLPKRAPLKHLLRQICADLYSAPQRVQSKRGFTLPLGPWLMGPLREIMEENLRTLRSSGLLDPAGLDSVCELFRREPNSSAWSRVWALVSLGHWLRIQEQESTLSEATVAVQSA